MSKCLIFVSETEPDGCCSVQFQSSVSTITLKASDLLFVRRVIDFIAETRGNPAYRDTQLKNGVFRRMLEKSVDLSASFLDTKILLFKDGEYDDSYVFRITPSASCWMMFNLRGELLDSFVEGMREIVDDFGVGKAGE